ncbi:MAG: prepilin-type N-terminal cleavage/methylation domain-containing protein [Tepidisphaerales bacterium]
MPTRPPIPPPDRRPTTACLPHRRGAFTLVEMLMVTGIASIVLGLLAMTLFVASAVNPSVETGPRQGLRATAGIDELAADLQRAWSVHKLSPTDLELLIPDASEDGLPDRVRYRWSGTPHTPFLREYATSPDEPYGAPRVLIQRVAELTFTPHLLARPLELTPMNVEEQLIDAFTPTSAASVRPVSPASHIAQTFVPSVTSSAAAFRISRVRVRMYRNPDMTGAVQLQVRTATGNLPGSSILLTQRVDAADLPLAPAWVDFPFVAPPSLSAANRYAIVLAPVGTTTPAFVQWTDSAPAAQGKAAFSATGGASFIATAGAVLFEVHGFVAGTRNAAPVAPATPRLDSLSVRLVPSAPGAAVVTHHIRLPNRPDVP